MNFSDEKNQFKCELTLGKVKKRYLNYLLLYKIFMCFDENN